MVIIQRGGLGDVTRTRRRRSRSCWRTARTPTASRPTARSRASCTAATASGLRDKERDIIRRAMQGRATTIMRSETMDWHTRLPQLIERGARRTRETPAGTVAALRAADPDDRRPAALRTSPTRRATPSGGPRTMIAPSSTHLPEPARPPAAPWRDGAARAVPAGRVAAASCGYSAQLKRYPYLTDAAYGGVTVNWATDRTSTSAAAVKWGVGTAVVHGQQRDATRTSITVGSTSEYQWTAAAGRPRRAPRSATASIGGATDLLGTDPSPQSRRADPGRVVDAVLVRRLRRLGPGARRRGNPRAGQRHGGDRGQRRALRRHHRRHGLPLGQPDQLRRPRADGRQRQRGLRAAVLGEVPARRSRCSPPRATTASATPS